jgi:hypothetical protein
LKEWIHRKAKQLRGEVEETALACTDEKAKELYECQLTIINTCLEEDIVMVWAEANKTLEATRD